MTTIKPESLIDWLKEHRNEINWVSLEWTWGETYEKYAKLYGCTPASNKTPLYHRWYARRTDIEYSYEGDIEGAIEHAQHYVCWDGMTLEFTNGILIGQEYRYDPNEENYPRDPYGMADPEVYCVSYEGLYYHTRDFYGHSRAYSYEGKTSADRGAEQ